MLDDVIVVLSVAIWAALWLRHLRYHDIIAPGAMGEVLAVGLAGGYMSGQLAGAMNAVFERLTGLDIIHDTLGFSQAALAALFVGVNEESLKFATTLVLVRGLGRLREPLDALVYATAVALGFATLENLGYAFHYGPGALLLRNFSAVPLHVGLGAVVGPGSGPHPVRPRGRRRLALAARPGPGRRPARALRLLPLLAQRTLHAALEPPDHLPRLCADQGHDRPLAPHISRHAQSHGRFRAPGAARGAGRRAPCPLGRSRLCSIICPVSPDAHSREQPP